MKENGKEAKYLNIFENMMTFFFSSSVHLIYARSKRMENKITQYEYTYKYVPTSAYTNVHI